MVNKHTCKRCGYETPFKSRLISHLSRKRPCPTKLCETSCDVLLAEIRRERCHDVETTESHDETEKGTPTPILDEKRETKEMLCNIYEERIERAIPEDIMRKGVDHPYEFVLNALRWVHFNAKYPEGQNVKSKCGNTVSICPGIVAGNVVFTGSSVCMVYKRGAWTAYRQDKVCKMLLHQSLGWLDLYVRKMKRDIPLVTRKAFYEFRNTIQEERDDVLLRTLLCDIDRILESHSCMVDMERRVTPMESPLDEECPSSDEDDVD